MRLEGTVARRVALVDVVSGLLDKGTVVNGQATVSLAGVDLIHVALQLLVTSAETLHQARPRGGAPLPPADLGPGPRPALPAAGAGPEFRTVARGPRPTASPSGSLALENPPHGPTTVGARDDQGLAGLVLALVELIRQLLERQAIRRMEGGALTEEEVERMGQALLELSAKMKELFEIFGLEEADVNLDLGPLGQLL